MTNNCRMDGINMRRVQCPIVDYAGDITLVHHWAPYDSLHLNDVSLSELKFNVVYDYVSVCHLCWWHVCYMVHLCCIEFLTFRCMDYVFMCDLCMCMPQCMDYMLNNLCCSNSQNLCLHMFLPILYVVFYPFSFMLQIVHVQSVYNINKLVGTICMIFIDFSRFFLPREAPKLVR
jgi:hypothetical protein